MTPKEHMPSIALNLMDQGQKVALATVIKTWGSAPRPIGSQLVISETGEFHGSVSGGCVEGAVILAGQEALNDGRCRILDFGVADDDAFAVGLACGGEIRILVEPVDMEQGPKRAHLEQIKKAYHERRAISVCVDLNDWSRELDLSTSLQISKLDEGRFTFVSMPRLRLVIVGAVHIAQSLAPMARMAGYQVFIVDPREGFASKSRFPEDEIVDDWPDDALDELVLDDHTAVVTLSHDPKIDLPALERAIRRPVFYIGSLGSRRTQGKRRDALIKAGYSQEEIARIHGPIGADIGAKTPVEIAISIMAEITERVRRPETQR